MVALPLLMEGFKLSALSFALSFDQELLTALAQTIIAGVCCYTVSCMRRTQAAFAEAVIM